MVAVYGNYLAIISNITILFSALFESMRAGIGNLVAENTPGRYMLFCRIHYCPVLAVSCHLFLFITTSHSIYLVMARQWICVGFCFFLYIDTEYIFVFGKQLWIVLVCIRIISGCFSPVVEGALHLSFSILLGYYWGLPGILAGRVAGLLFLICWKPYFYTVVDFKFR